jgi:starch phosphorylase
VGIHAAGLRGDLTPKTIRKVTSGTESGCPGRIILRCQFAVYLLARQLPVLARTVESMARLTPHFSATRTVREYTEAHYLPAADAYLARAADKGAMGTQIVNWVQTLEHKWPALHFGEMKIETTGEQHVLDIQVYLRELDPSAIRVELYADGTSGGDPVRQETTRIRQLVGAVGGYLYRGSVPATRPPTDYTVRIIPRHDGVAVPLEAARILWQR